MKPFPFTWAIAVALFFFSCSGNKNPVTNKDALINDELKRITVLLRDSIFSVEMAKNQEAAYYASQGQPIPDFFSQNADVTFIERSLKDEKIATNLAGFYALECGIGLLIEKKGGTPVAWLNKIIGRQLDSTEVLVLNQFANATWKAGQPFRGLKRIQKDNFVSAVFLSEDETKKDYDQVYAAAIKLLPIMQNIPEGDQLQKLSQLLKDKQFALGMAEHMEAAYYIALEQSVPPFLKPGGDTATINKNAMEEKVAINIAGFYALECGLSYLATAEMKLPSSTLDSILNDRISEEEKRLFERFANATWKAGQPFRGLDRITRDNFTSFDLLSPGEVEKDWVQIKAAAEKLRKSLVVM